MSASKRSHLPQEDLVATLSHEIRTPMNTVSGLVHLLAATPLDARQREMVETLQANTVLLLEQINALLQFLGQGQSEVAPNAAEGKAPLTAVPSISAPARQKDTILLVEDYPTNIMVATMMLENIGFKVVTAASGTEALARVEEADAPFTAIFMDVQMQDMDGLETTRRIRALELERGYRHRIIGVTAHALAGDRQRCIEAGMDDYISKPVHPDLLAQKLALSAEA